MKTMHLAIIIAILVIFVSDFVVADANALGDTFHQAFTN